MRSLTLAALLTLSPIAGAAAEKCAVTYEIGVDAAPAFWGVHRGCLVIVWAEWADG